MANPNDNQDLPDLEAFKARIEEAASATEQFAASVTAAAPAVGGGANQQQVQNLEPILRDLVSAMDMVHSELVSLHETIRSLTE